MPHCPICNAEFVDATHGDHTCPAASEALRPDSDQRSEATAIVAHPGAETAQFSTGGVAPNGNSNLGDQASIHANAETRKVPVSALPIAVIDPNQSLASGAKTPNIAKGGTVAYGLAEDYTPSQSIKLGEMPAADTEHLLLRKFALSFDSQQESLKADYLILGEAGKGKGGMGIVSRATQRSLNRTVAVKRLRDGLAGMLKEQEKFLSEAVITGQLEHPNIIPIHELGRAEDGSVFYAMKYVEGLDWQDKMASLSEAENIDVLLKVSDAVAFAHAQRVIHRDLKPANVRIGNYGEVLVMDWGLAARLDSNEEFPPAGTPLYMAPEMAIAYLKRVRPGNFAQRNALLLERVGNPQPVGTHSDIYLLGAMLFQVVTRRAPHAGRNYARCIENAALNRFVEFDASGELLDIALQAMSTKIEHRHATVGEFQAALRQYQSHVQSHAIARTADGEFRSAEELRCQPQLGTKVVYDLYSAARYGYRNALELWPENTAARQQLQLIEQAYADAAYKNGDLDLAHSLLDPLHDEQRALQEQINKEIKERDAKLGRYRTLQRIAYAAVAVTLLASLAYIGLTVVLGRSIVDLKADKDALSKQFLDVAEQKTRIERDNATLNSEKQRLIGERADLDLRMGNLRKDAEVLKQSKSELERTTKHLKAETESLTARAQFEKYFADFSGIRFDQSGGELRRAFDTLMKVSPEQRGWEWYRMHFLCDWPRDVYALRPSPESTYRNAHVCLSRDGTRLIVGVTDAAATGYVAVWDTAILKKSTAWKVLPAEAGLIARWKLPAAEITAVRLSDRGELAIAATKSSARNAQLIGWNVDTRKIVAQTETHHPMVSAVDFSPIGAAFSDESQSFRSAAEAPILVTAGSEGSICLWQLNGKWVELFPSSLPNLTYPRIDAVTFSKDGRFILSLHSKAGSSTLRIKNASQVASQPATVLGPRWLSRAEIVSAEICPFQPNLLALATKGGAVSLHLIDFENSKIGDALDQASHGRPLTSITFTAKWDRRFLLAGRDDGIVSLWELIGENEGMVFRSAGDRRWHDDSLVSCVAPAEGSGIAYSSDVRGAIYAWKLHPPVADLQYTTREHRGGVTAFSNDASNNVRTAGDSAGSIHVWKQPDSAPLELFSGHRDVRTLQVFGGAKSHLVTVADGTACYWDWSDTPTSTRLVRRIDVPKNLGAVGADGNVLVAVDRDVDSPPSFWSLTKDLPTLRDARSITALGVSASSAEASEFPLVITGAQNGQVYRWLPDVGAITPTTLTKMGTSNPHPDRSVLAVAVQSQSIAYTLDSTGVVARWNLQNGGVDVRSVRTRDMRGRPRLHVSSDGSTLIVVEPSTANPMLRVHNALDLKLAASQPPQLTNRLLDADVSADGRQISVLSEPGRLLEWRHGATQWRPHPLEPVLRKTVKRMAGNSGAQLTGVQYAGPNRILTYGYFSPPAAAADAPGGGFVILWDCSEQAPRLLRQIWFLAPVEVTVPLGDGKWAAIYRDGRYAQWQVRSGATMPLPIRDVPFPRPVCVRAVADEGNKAAIAVIHDQNTDRLSVERWDVATGKRESVGGLTISDMLNPVVHSVQLSGKHVVLTLKGEAQDRILSWDLEASKPDIDIVPALPDSQRLQFVAYSRSGPHLAVVPAGPTTSCFDYDRVTGNLTEHTGMPFDNATAVALDPDGQRLILGNQTGEVSVWTWTKRGALPRTSNARSAEPLIERELLKLPGHQTAITRVAFEDNGRRLVTGDASGKLVVHRTSGWSDK